MKETANSILRRYALSVFFVAAAIVVRFALDPVLAKSQFLFTFLLAIVAAALTGGRGPCFLATALSLPAAMFFFAEPRFSFAITNPAEGASLIVLAGTGILIALVIGGVRRPSADEAAANSSFLKTSLLRRTAFLAAVLLALGAGTRALIGDFERQRELQAWVTHTYQVLAAARDTLSNLQDAETGQRGFLITGDKAYLEPYESADSRERASRQRLEELTSGNPSQKARLRKLDRIAQARLDLIQQTILLRRQNNPAAALEMVRSGEGKRLMDQARDVLAAVEAEENRLLATRTEAANAEGEKVRWTIGLSSVALIMLLVVAATMIERDIVRRELITQQLAEANQKAVTMLESMSDGFNAFDREWRYQYVNAAGARMVGKTPEELLGKNIWDLWPQAADSPFGAAYRRAVAENIPLSVEAFYGEPLNRWYEVRCYPSPNGLSLFFSDTTEARKRNEQMRLLGSAVRQTKDGVLILMIGDGERCHPEPVFTNAAFEQMTGYSIEELRAGALSELYGPQLNPSRIERPRPGCRPKCPAGLEQKIRRKDGSETWVEFDFKPLIGDSGEYTHCVWTCRDTTERKRASAESRLLASIVECSDDAIISKDLDGIVLSWNKGAERIYGYKPEEAIGRHISFLEPQGQDEYLKFLPDLQQGKMIDHYETEHVRKDQTRISVSLTLSPLWENDELVGASVISRDITEQKRTQKALALSEERYRSLVLVSSQVVWTTQPDGKVEDIPTWRAFTGQTVQEVQGWGWLDAVHPDDRERTAGIWSHATKNISFYNTEYRLRRQDGQYRDMLVHGVPVLEKEGVIREWVGTCADITERKQAEQEVLRLNQDLEHRVRERTAQWEAANKELESFAYSVSHDLRAPLRAVDGFSRILVEEYAPELPQEAQRFLGLVRTNAVHMGTLIDGLLSFSRLGRQALVKQTVAPKELVAQVLDVLASEIKERHIDIRIGRLPLCQGDSLLLKQVFQNLLSNAVKYTRKCAAAQIHVGSFPSADLGSETERSRTGAPACLPDDEIVYYVQDNGAGFDMRYANKLFGVFQRLHKAEDYDGTGIGLATVFRIVTRHGGRIWAKAAVDQGATFYFTIAAAAAAADTSAWDEIPESRDEPHAGAAHQRS